MRRPSHAPRRDPRQRGIVAAIVVVAAALVAVSAALVVARTSSGTANASAPRSSHSYRALNVVSTSPAPGAAGVASDSAVTVRFTTALSNTSPFPILTPPVAGTWVRPAPDEVTFAALAPLPPGVPIVLTVPGGPTGVLGSHGQRLTRNVSVDFTVAPMSTLRLQQLLAELGYLPVTFTPASAPAAPDEQAAAQLGSFTWRWTTMPSAFTSLWSPGIPNVVTEGAIMAFEDQHGLTTDGQAGPQVWSALLHAAAVGQPDTAPYDWADVSTEIPESVTIWSDGRPVYSTPANTGIEAAPTELGTWPVYARFTSTTMSGTNPDGSHYDDPGVPWVSYFHGGDALHGFIRASYGTPQSLGCVEMPPGNAEVVFPYTPLGTLVTVD